MSNNNGSKGFSTLGLAGTAFAANRMLDAVLPGAGIVCDIAEAVGICESVAAVEVACGAVEAAEYAQTGRDCVQYAYNASRRR